MLNLSLKELELKTKNGGIKDYKSMSIDKWLRILNTRKPIKNFYGLKIDKGTNDRALGDIGNLYRLKNDKDIKDRIIRDIRTIYKSDEVDYYKPIRTGNAFNSNYIEYESNRN